MQIQAGEEVPVMLLDHNLSMSSARDF